MGNSLFKRVKIRFAIEGSALWRLAMTTVTFLENQERILNCQAFFEVASVR